MSTLRTLCCGVEPEVTVRLSVRLPLRFNRRVTKHALRSRDVVIEAANWERAIWSCPGCYRIWPPGHLLGPRDVTLAVRKTLTRVGYERPTDPT